MPKFLKFVKIIQYYSILFIRVLTHHPARGQGAHLLVDVPGLLPVVGGLGLLPLELLPQRVELALELLRVLRPVRLLLRELLVDLSLLFRGRGLAKYGKFLIFGWARQSEVLSEFRDHVFLFFYDNFQKFEIFEKNISYGDLQNFLPIFAIFHNLSETE